MVAKARGNQGNWFAKIDAPREPELHGKSLPCIWDYWVKGGGKKYIDPDYAAGQAKAVAVVEALQRDGLAIMRKRGQDNGTAWQSAGYIGVFEVTNVQFGQSLTFDIVRRVCDLR